MADLATIAAPLPKTPARVPSLIDRKLNARPSRRGLAFFVVALSAGIGYIVFHLSRDLDAVKNTGSWPYMLLGLALLIALGFEFVNGFHDTANAVATVIYTNSLEPHVAVVWSGLCNLAGVLASSGAVAFAIITLLPVDLILQVSSGAGFAMVFALLIAAILWNLGTWWLGLPASSSHTMVGSIIGVGIANQLLNPHTGTSGVDWEQAMKVLKALLFSPVIGFTVAAVVLLISKWLVRYPSLVRSTQRKPAAALAHPRPDGAHLHRRELLPWIQRRPKRHGPHHAHPHRHGADGLRAQSCRRPRPRSRTSLPPRRRPEPSSTATSIEPSSAPIRAPSSPITSAPSSCSPTLCWPCSELVNQLDLEVGHYREYKDVPAQDQANVRNDMYVVSEALGMMAKAHNPAFSPEEWAGLKNYKARSTSPSSTFPTG